MSAKKSWDIQPRPRRAPSAPLKVEPPPVVVKRPSAPPVRRAGAPSRAAHPSAPLRERRRRSRRRLMIALAVLVVALLGGGFWALSQPALRIQHVEAAGPHADGTPGIAMGAITGSYFHVIPRDSIFFFPKESVRAAILAAYPDLAAVSISRAGFDTTKIDAIERVTAFVWCGESESASSTDASCYDADSNGLLFTAAGTTTLPVFAPLTASSTDPLGATVADAGGILGVMQFDRAAASLGAKVVSIQIRDDEADLFTVGGTRITYVIGHEADAAALAAAAFPTLDLNSGAIDYIDLRFSGKVYYKRRSEE